MSKLTNQRIGSVIGKTIESSSANILGQAAQPELLKSAGLTQEQYTNCLILLSASAALNAIESAQLAPIDENELAEALFEWCKAQPGELRTTLTEQLDTAAEDLAEAYSQDRTSPRQLPDLPELELTFADLLFNLGPDSAERAQACIQLSLATPKALWESSWNNTFSTLSRAGLIEVAN